MDEGETPNQNLSVFINQWNKKKTKRVKNSQTAHKEEASTIFIQTLIRMWLMRKFYISIQKKHKHRTLVVKELLETEKTYVTILSSLVTEFMEPLSENKLITDSEIRAIFSNIGTIKALNSTLYADLSARILNWSINQKFADIFLEFTAYFLVYLDYVKEYNNAVTCLVDCCKNEKISKFFKEKMKGVEKYENDSVLSLLITPVQRIPRYNLLLQDIVKVTWDFHPDYPTLLLALEKIKTTANAVNTKAKEAEALSKIFSIQSSLSGKFDNLIARDRRVVREGEVKRYKVGKKKEKPVYVILFNDLIIVCKNESRRFKQTVKMEFILQVSLFDAIVVQYKDDDSLNRRNCFSVETRHSKVYLSADTPQEKQEWITDINHAVLQTNEKHLFYEEKKGDVAKQRAEEARAIITEKYTHIRVRGSDDHSSSPPSPHHNINNNNNNNNNMEDNSPSEAPLRKFASKKLAMNPNQKFERKESAQLQTEELLREEQENIEKKQKKAEKKAEDFKELAKNKYKAQSAEEKEKGEREREKERDLRTRSWSLKRKEAQKQMEQLNEEENSSMKLDRTKEVLKQKYVNSNHVLTASLEMNNKPHSITASSSSSSIPSISSSSPQSPSDNHQQSNLRSWAKKAKTLSSHPSSVHYPPDDLV